MRATAHVCLLWAVATCGRQAGAFIHSTRAGRFGDGPPLPARSPNSRQRTWVTPSYTATCGAGRWPPRSSRSSYSRLRALPEDADVESSTRGGPSTTSSASEATEAGGLPGRAEGGRKSAAAGTGKDGQFISKLSRRLADSFPLLTADEIKNEVRMLLNPETKGELNKVGGRAGVVLGCERQAARCARRCYFSASLYRTLLAFITAVPGDSSTAVGYFGRTKKREE